MSALADARFRRLLIGSAVSSFGDSALYLSLAIWVKDLTGSNAAAGAIFLTQGLSSLLAPWVGHVIDRVRRRPLLIGTNAVTGIAVLALLLVHSREQLWLIYAVAAFYGAAAPLIRRLGEARTLGVGLIAWAVASLVYAVPSVPVACTALAIFGIAVLLYAVALATAGQRFTPPRLQGRVGSARSMLTNLSQTLSIATGAALIGTVDYRLLLLVIAAVATAAALPVILHPVPPPSLAETRPTVAMVETTP